MSLYLSPDRLQAQISWPDGKKAAIILTYDDGLRSQRDIVMPQLEAKGFRGTFFLYGLVVEEQDVPEWRAAAERGHELGNHSMYHPCLAGSVDSSSISLCHALECYSVKDILGEIRMMNSFLYAIDGRKEHPYAYPCGQWVAGGEDYSQPLLDSGLAKYSRTTVENPIISDPGELNLSQIPAFAVLAGCQADEMIRYVEKVLAMQGFGVLVFHGVGGDYLTVDAVEHQKLVDYLSAHSNEIWVGTFSEILDYVVAQMKK